MSSSRLSSLFILADLELLALALLASAQESLAARGAAAAGEQTLAPLATLATLASSVAVGLAPSPADVVATATTKLLLPVF